MDALRKILGSGIITSLLGYILVLIEVAKLALVNGSMPATPEEWLEFVGSIIVGTIMRLIPDPKTLRRIYESTPPPAQVKP